MSAPLEIHADLSGRQLQAGPWGFKSRIAFRFCLLYFGLFCLFTQIFGTLILIPSSVQYPSLSTLTPFRQVICWTAERVFGYKQPLAYLDGGSGDSVFSWVQAFCLLLVAAAGTGVWSAIDRRRVGYDYLYQCFGVFIRFALAGQLFVYGLSKVIPLQMPFPYLARLLEPYGNFSPMGVLWSFIGASPAYESFVGCAELAVGLLLVVPATSMLGALISLIDLVQVFALNMAYDVPVKLFSFHLMLMTLFLLAPERSRLVRFCRFDCAIEAPATRTLFASSFANRIATMTQLLFGLLLLVANLYGTQHDWYKWGGGAPKSPLYGIWNVDEMAIDGVVRAPLLTDYDRWRRIVFEFPQGVTFQRMDDSFGGFAAQFDSEQNVLTLTERRNGKWEGELTVHRQGTQRMTLDGQLGGHKERLQLSIVARNKFTLISRGFHWIQDYPYNR